MKILLPVHIIFVEIIPERQVPFGNGILTYGVPANNAREIKIGQIVEIPLRSRREKGIIFRILEKKPDFETLEIGRILSPVLLSSQHFAFLNTISEYNFCSYSKALSLFLPEKIWHTSGQAPQETWWELQKITTEKIRGTKQKQILELLKAHNGKMREQEIRALINVPSHILTKLAEKKMVEKKLRSFVPPKIPAEFSFPEFTPEQETALQKLHDSDRSLLFGPAGAGKTMLALKRIAETILSGKTALFLLPERFMSTAFLEFCQRYFPSEIFALYHSFLSTGEKTVLWWRVHSGQTRLIFGTRAALFLPFRDLGLIVLDEEHDASYKSDQTPRYHARTAAAQLAAAWGAKLLLQSATPSFETFARAENKEIMLCTLHARFGRLIPPHMTVVDLRQELAARNFSPLSGVLQDRIKITLEAKKQVLLLLNRRGKNSALVCRQCGVSVLCTHCQHRSTLHQDHQGKEFLLCHQCGHMDRIPPTCPRCHSTMLKGFGVGTQEIEREVKKLFPKARIVRADRDSTARKNAAQEIFTALADGSADILIGTQIIAKGLDVPNIGLVGILLADTELHLPDFRASEYAFQLLSQVAGRTGRQGAHGEVILQTYLPEHPAVTFCQSHDYRGFYRQEIAERMAMKLPPFTEMIRLIITDMNEKKALQKAHKWQEKFAAKAKLMSESECTVSMAPALNKKQFHKFHYHIFLTGKNPALLLTGENLSEIRVDRDPVESF